MTAERYRAPLCQGAPAHGYSLDRGADVTDLFVHDTNLCHVPHPDFAARAAIWKDQRAGLISLAEASRRSAAIGAETPTKPSHSQHKMRAPARPRHTRPAPNESRQYAQPMATTAARDDRLTPQAKAFLQVLRARCGKGRRTEITKATMGAVMARSARTIRRYLSDLVRFGYVETEIRRTSRGLHTGLVVKLTAEVVPFFEDAAKLAGWLATAPDALARPFTGRVLSGKAGVTILTPKNQSRMISLPSRWKNLFRRGGRGEAEIA